MFNNVYEKDYPRAKEDHRLARRNDHSREEIREMALAAAEQIVSQHGPGGLTARKVASAIGYTVGTLYLVFENVDDLILCVNGRTLDRLQARMLQERALCRDGREALLRLGETYIRFAHEDPHRWELIFGHRSEKIPDWLEHKVARMFDLVEAALRTLASTRSEQEVALAARALWGGVHGICILALTKKLRVAGVESVQDLAQSLIATYLRGFTQG